MHWNKWIRQFHRWVSIAFTLGFIANTIDVFALGQKPGILIGLTALLPLIFLLVTGLYLFALPYITKRRGAPGAAAAE